MDRTWHDGLTICEMVTLRQNPRYPLIWQMRTMKWRLTIRTLELYSAHGFEIVVPTLFKGPYLQTYPVSQGACRSMQRAKPCAGANL